MPTSDAARDPRPETPAQSGVHPVEWAAEFLGTFAVLLVGLSAVCFDFGPASPLHGLPTSLRFLITGLVFAATGSLFAITPPGRRSGAHLNPVVTLTFWTQRKVHWHDLVGYVVAQFLGAIVGTVVVRVLWGRQAVAVHVGTTEPGPGVSAPDAVLLEAAMTAAVMLTILFMTSRAATARFTPLVLWLMIAVFVWQFAPFTGTSLNPARSLGPALVAPLLAHYWIYVVGPCLGGAVAAGVFAIATPAEVLTTKLFHDARYPSTMASRLPVRS
ncbi:MAG: aquaporin family protein [Acidobacteria bacterium]|nr:aquaporin family protein [Acidobacteriota bacterium]